MSITEVLAFHGRRTSIHLYFGLVLALGALPLISYLSIGDFPFHFSNPGKGNSVARFSRNRRGAVGHGPAEGANVRALRNVVVDIESAVEDAALGRELNNVSLLPKPRIFAKPDRAGPFVRPPRLWPMTAFLKVPSNRCALPARSTRWIASLAVLSEDGNLAGVPTRTHIAPKEPASL